MIPMTTTRLAALALTLLAAASATADITKIQITGVFAATQADDASGLHFFAPLEGQAFTMTFDYDPGVPDSQASDNLGTYNHAVPAHQFTLSSGGITFSEPSSYRFEAYFNSGGPGSSRYSVGSTSDAASASGLALPGNTDAFVFGFIHPVSNSVVDFLDDGLALDPLPESPFFIGAPTAGAFVYIDLTTYNSELDEYFDDSITATITSIQIVSEPSQPSLSNFSYDSSTNQFNVSIKGAPNTAYILSEAADLDFSNPDQRPIPLTGASVSVGSVDGNSIVTDGSGDATVEAVALGTPKKDATFIRAETP